MITSVVTQIQRQPKAVGESALGVLNGLYGKAFLKHLSGGSLMKGNPFSLRLAIVTAASGASSSAYSATLTQRLGLNK